MAPVELRLGLIGCGTVGSAFATSFAERHAFLEQVTSARLRLAAVAVARPHLRDPRLAPAPFTDDAAALAADPTIDILVEASGAPDVLNGTTTFVLGRLEQQRPFTDAVRDAQRDGFAEQNPASDLNGSDAAAKLAILCSIAWREPLTLSQVRVRGIDSSVVETVDAAREFGGRVRLVATAERNGRVHASVEPTILDGDDPLATGTGVHNVVQVRTALAGTLTWHGAGAGGRSTASALLADTIAAARAIVHPRSHGGTSR